MLAHALRGFTMSAGASVRSFCRCSAQRVVITLTDVRQVTLAAVHVDDVSSPADNGQPGTTQTDHPRRTTSTDRVLSRHWSALRKTAFHRVRRRDAHCNINNQLTFITQIHHCDCVTARKSDPLPFRSSVSRCIDRTGSVLVALAYTANALCISHQHHHHEIRRLTRRSKSFTL